MTDWILPIPKILHLYWGRNKKLSYMKYLTAFSFSKLNPDWKIMVYFPTETCVDTKWDGFEQKQYNYIGDDYFSKLKEIPNLFFKQVQFSNLPKDLSEVHKSDLLRLNLLSSVGGVWSDFDIFYTQPITAISFNRDMEIRDTLICYDTIGQHNSIGFLAGKENNKFFFNLFQMAIKNIRNIEKLQYQNIGRDLYNYFFRYNEERKKTIDISLNINIGNMLFHTVYPFHWNQIDLIFGHDMYRLSKETIGIHWFAGSDKTSIYENIITEDNIKENKDKYLLRLMGEING